MRVKKGLVFPTFSPLGEVIKSEILGLFHRATPKNIEIIEIITCVSPGLIGQDVAIARRWNDGVATSKDSHDKHEKAQK